MTLLDLANELLLSIAGNLTRESDINALAQTNRRLYSLLNLVLYRYAVQRHNHSALHWAAFHGFSSIVCMLLAEGASVRATTIRSKRTALHLASAAGHLPIVEALIQMGANVNAQSSTGTTPLHGAVSGGFEGVTQALLENGADYMKTLPGGNRPTVLHIAS
jgi:ankyrin repeat protein